jgi:hypothetical protein
MQQDASFFIDNTKPSTSWDGNNSVWQKTDANIHLTCHDGTGSGCAITKYRLDTDDTNTIAYGAWQIYDKNILLSTDGNYAIDFNSSDNVANIGDINTFYMFIDKTLPIISDPQPATNQNTFDLTPDLNFAISDTRSGIVSCTITPFINNNPQAPVSGTITGGRCLYVSGTLNIGDTILVQGKIQDNAGNNSSDLNTGKYTIIAFNSPPNINILQIDGYSDAGSLPMFTYSVDGNLTIDFNVFDTDSNSLLVDLNYATTAAINTGTVIVDDLNLSKLSPTGPYHCEDTNFQNTTHCAIDWNILTVPDGNYFLHITVTDGSLTDQNTSDRNFNVNNNPGYIGKCGAITSSETWFDGNTYVLMCDVNVYGSGVDLNIQPGAFVKFAPSTTSLFANTSGRINANGTANKRITFMSCKDQNFGANTSTIPQCAGVVPTSNRYGTAIWIQSTSGMTTNDTFSYLNMYDANVGIRIDKNILSINDNNFTKFKCQSSPVTTCNGIRVTQSSAVKIYDNNFVNFVQAVPILISTASTYSGEIYKNYFTGLNSYSGIYANGVVFAGSVHDNNFNNFVNIAGYALFHATANFPGSIYNNTVSSSVSSNTPAFNVNNFTGSIYNNTFKNNSTMHGVFITGTSSGSIYNNNFSQGRLASIGLLFSGISTTKVYNNTFSDISSTGYAIQNTSTFNGTITRNLFTNINGTAIKTISVGAVAGYNAYYNVNIIGVTGNQTVGDQNIATSFTTDPFIADNTDRNFLLNTNATGGAKLINAGGVNSTGIDINNYFNLKTVKMGNKLDTGIVDIGYHYDQNGPYFVVVKPNGGETVNKTYIVDFNVESGYGKSSDLNVSLQYSALTTGGTVINSKLLNDASYSCSAGPVFVCSYSWDTVPVIPGTYYLVMNGNDANGISSDASDATFTLLQNTAPSIAILQIDSYFDNQPLPIFSYTRDKNLSIVFVVQDLDSNNLQIDINYSASKSPYTGTPIYAKLDLNNFSTTGPLKCNDTNFFDSTQCSIDWNIVGVTDRNYFLHMTVADGSLFDQNSSDNNLGIDNTKPSTSWDGNNSIWQKTDANIHLTCHDGTGSGCSTTQYRLNGGIWQTYISSILIDTDGNWTLDFNSIDNVNNIGDTNTFYVLIDTVAPDLQNYSPLIDTTQATQNFVFIYSSDDGNGSKIQTCDYNAFADGAPIAGQQNMLGLVSIDNNLCVIQFVAIVSSGQRVTVVAVATDAVDLDSLPITSFGEIYYVSTPPGGSQTGGLPSYYPPIPPVPDDNEAIPDDNAVVPDENVVDTTGFCVSSSTCNPGFICQNFRCVLENMADENFLTPDVIINPPITGLVGLTKFDFSSWLDLGVWCFGPQKDTCLIRTNNPPIFNINYISLLDVLIVVSCLMFWFLMFKQYTGLIAIVLLVIKIMSLVR